MSQNNPNQSGQQTQQPSQKPGQGGQQGGQQRQCFSEKRTPSFCRGFLFVGLLAYRERCVLPLRQTWARV